MSTTPAQVRPTTPSWTGDVWGGLAAMLVALPSSVAFGIVTYTALGPSYVAVGAMAGMLGAVALGLITPLIGRTGGLISAPCAPSAAVLSAFIVGLLAGEGGTRLEPAAVLPLLALTALLSGGLQVLYGAAGGGRLIKFIPYPVVSGYLSGVGLLIALGQLPKLLGLPADTPLHRGLLNPALWRKEGLIAGLVTMLCMLTAPRLTRRVPATIIGLGGGMAAYFAQALFLPDLLRLAGNPLVIGPILPSGSLSATLTGPLKHLLSVNLADIRLVLVPALTLSVLLSIDTLKTCVGLDALTRNRHRSNRELVGQGLGNLAACLLGGLPGAGTMGPTLVNLSSGGRTFRAGLCEGVFVLLALLFLGRLIAWVPIGVLAGILIVVASRMFDRTMFRLLRYHDGRFDFAVIAGVIVVALTVDLIAAAGVGVVLASVLFIRDQIRGAVIRRKQCLNQVSSKTRRPSAERDALKQLGNQAVYCELQGNLFFGTADQVVTNLEPDLRTCRFILLDLRRVQSLDYTAAHLFEQMHSQLVERGGELLFSGMPSGLLHQRAFEKYLVHLGVVRAGGGVRVCDTLDEALEWMENRLLESAGVRTPDTAQALGPTDFDLFRGFDARTLDMLSGRLRERTLTAGEQAFAQGDPGGELFLVRRGSVRILLPLDGGRQHHVATIGPGEFFGELSFLDCERRSATAEAKESTELYVLTRACIDGTAPDEAALGAQLFARLALAIAQRLRQADAELRALQDR